MIDDDDDELFKWLLNYQLHVFLRCYARATIIAQPMEGEGLLFHSFLFSFPILIRMKRDAGS